MVINIPTLYVGTSYFFSSHNVLCSTNIIRTIFRWIQSELF